MAKDNVTIKVETRPAPFWMCVSAALSAGVLGSLLEEEK